MPASRSRGKNPQNPDSAQLPGPDLDANSSSTGRSIETSIDLGFQSIPGLPSPPLPLRRSLRISEASANAQSPPPAMHANPASAAPSAETSSWLGFEATSTPPPRVQSLFPRMSTGGRVGRGGGNLCLFPEYKRGGSARNRKRGRPPKVIKIGGNNGDESVARRRPGQPKRAEIPKEAVVVEEEEIRGDDNVANGNDTDTVNFADSQSGGVQIADDELVILRSTSRGIDKRKGKVIVGEELEGGVHVAASGREKLIYGDKGKGKLVIDVDSEPVNISDSDSAELREMVQDAVKNLSLSLALEVPMGPPHEEIHVRVPTPRREAQRKIAIELAPEYARFKNEKGDQNEKDDELLPGGPCPFSTAMKIIEEREARFRVGEAGFSKGDKSARVRISWTPFYGLFRRKSSLLKELSLKALAENAEEIETLEGIPYTMRSKLSFMLCHTRKMNVHHLSQLIEGSPMELRLSDCSWATDKDFEDAFGKCDKSNLEVKLVFMI